MTRTSASALTQRRSKRLKGIDVSEMTTAPLYVDQSADQLILRVFRSHPHKGSFNVFDAAVLVDAGIRVEAFIIGTSHAVLVTCGPSKMAEVFSCAGVGRAEPDFHKALAALNGSVRIALGGMDYRFVAERMGLSPGRRRLTDLESKPRTQRQALLSYRFPQCAQETAPATFVSVGLHDNGVSWETAHSYPNEDRIVFTRTELAT